MTNKKYFRCIWQIHFRCKKQFEENFIHLSMQISLMVFKFPFRNLHTARRGLRHKDRMTERHCFDNQYCIELLIFFNLKLPT